MYPSIMSIIYSSSHPSLLSMCLSINFSFLFYLSIYLSLFVHPFTHPATHISMIYMYVCFYLHPYLYLFLNLYTAHINVYIYIYALGLKILRLLLLSQPSFYPMDLILLSLRASVHCCVCRLHLPWPLLVGIGWIPVFR